MKTKVLQSVAAVLRSVSDTIEASSPLVLWHGSHRWSGPPQLMPAGKMKSEEGSGLYLTTSTETAAKYAKGGGSILRFELDPNLTFLENVNIPIETMVNFLKETPRIAKRSSIEADLRKAGERRGSDSLPGYYLENLILNYGSLKGSIGPSLALFFVDQGADANLSKKSAEDWVILYNLDKILSYTKVPRSEAVDSPRIPLS